MVIAIVAIIAFSTLAVFVYFLEKFLFKGMSKEEKEEYYKDVGSFLAQNNNNFK